MRDPFWHSGEGACQTTAAQTNLGCRNFTAFSTITGASSFLLFADSNWGTLIGASTRRSPLIRWRSKLLLLVFLGAAMDRSNQKIGTVEVPLTISAEEAGK